MHQKIIYPYYNLNFNLHENQLSYSSPLSFPFDARKYQAHIQPRSLLFICFHHVPGWRQRRRRRGRRLARRQLIPWAARTSPLLQGPAHSLYLPTKILFGGQYYVFTIFINREHFNQRIFVLFLKISAMFILSFYLFIK